MLRRVEQGLARRTVAVTGLARRAREQADRLEVAGQLAQAVVAGVGDDDPPAARSDGDAARVLEGRLPGGSVGRAGVDAGDQRGVGALDVHDLRAPGDRGEADAELDQEVDREPAVALRSEVAVVQEQRRREQRVVEVDQLDLTVAGALDDLADARDVIAVLLGRHRLRHEAVLERRREQHRPAPARLQAPDGPPQRPDLHRVVAQRGHLIVREDPRSSAERVGLGARLVWGRQRRDRGEQPRRCEPRSVAIYRQPVAERVVGERSKPRLEAG